MRASPFLAAAAMVSAASCGASVSREKIDIVAEAAAVRTVDSALNAAIQRRDLEAIMAAYAPEAVLLWQNEPRLTGAEIRKIWAQSFALRGFALRLHSRTIRVAQAGDLALDEGALELELPGEQGIAALSGKYLVVFRKVDGRWKILYDVYNTNPAAPGAAAASN